MHPAEKTVPKPLPIIDIGPFFGQDSRAKQALAEQVGQACREHGFFQVVNHGVPLVLQEEVLEQCKEFFNLPLSVKERYDKDVGGHNRGYERLRAQNFEKRATGDLKEGFYVGTDLPEDHPYVHAGAFNMGPNKYPNEVADAALFKTTMDGYYGAMSSLARTLLRILAATLGMQDDWVEQFCDTPIATLRLLHYPPQQPDAPDSERGAGAHTDFGAVTILLQDRVGGLQVWSRESAQWVDVTPLPGAFVVNLGNLMMRWTNDKYLSNLHRVINKSGQERYSVPFFFSGNPYFLVACLENCEDEARGAKYPPVTVNDWMIGRYADTYSQPGERVIADLVTTPAD